jgi:hypothetical protein
MIGKQIDYVFLGAVPMVVLKILELLPYRKGRQKQLMLRHGWFQGHM